MDPIQKSRLRIERAVMRRLGTFDAKDRSQMQSPFTDHQLELTLFADDWEDELAQVIDAAIVPYSPSVPNTVAKMLQKRQVAITQIKVQQGKSGNHEIEEPNAPIYHLNQSAQLLGLPRVEPCMLLSCLQVLVELDADWFQSATEGNLYLHIHLFSSASAFGESTRPFEYKLLTMMGLQPLKSTGTTNPIG